MSQIVIPRLFIVCRLCVENTGIYQILPEVQKKIMFCFGINIEPYDGMSQLICKSCEVVLCNFFEIKQRYIEQQKKLKDLTFGSLEASTSVLKDISGIPDFTDQNKENEKCTVTSTNQEENSNTIDEVKWQKYYVKKIVCSLCNAHCKSKTAFKFHNLRVHSTFRGKHGKVFKKDCQVKLPRIDNKPNLTGSYKNVVLSDEKIIENCKSNYYVAYFKKPFYVEKVVENVETDTNDDSTDSSESDIAVKHKRKQSITKRKPKRRRIDSNSSNDTVLLDNKSEKEYLNERSELIDLNDSTDEESKDSITKEATTNQNEPANDYGTVKESTIMDIVSSCVHKHLKKYDSKSNNSTGIQLRRKILSVGRKIINRKGFSSTAILRFLEYKNLDMIWLPKSATNVGNESNYVKIMTRMKNASDNIDKDTGWIDYCPVTEKIAEISNVCTVSDETIASIPVTDVQSINILTNNANVTDSAVLYPVSTNESKKILNASPVANPKQLPKKSDKICSATSAKPLVTRNENTNIAISNPAPLTFEQEHPAFDGMPIITATTSLADVNEKKVEKPRIKIKPLTELMSQETLSRMNNPVINLENVTIDLNSTQYPLPIIEQNITSTNIPILQSKETNESQECVNTNKDYLILDSLDLPNRKTNSPFEYFKTILHIHNILLLDTNVELSKEFHCLIKFKVLFKQESKVQPVILCISLHCFGNAFCIKIRDRNQDDIDISKISANWQWEILKIFRDDVVTKLQSNAQKLGREMSENAFKFIYLFKSIKFVEAAK